MELLYIKLAIGLVLLSLWVFTVYFPRPNDDKLVSFIQLCLAGLAGHLLTP